jgi:Uma2 family endonuclease
VTEQQASSRRRATYQDVVDAPEHMVAEIIDGELYTWPRPASPHLRAGSLLSAALIASFQEGFRDARPGGWWMAREPELHFDSDVLVPDLTGWRRERMPVWPNVAYFTLAPDWVCEVLSTSTARIDRTKKLAIYAREQVSHAWLLDPLSRTLEVFVREAHAWRLHAKYAEHERVRAVPFDAIELDLSTLWTPSTGAPSTGASSTSSPSTTSTSATKPHTRPDVNK